VPVYTYRGFDAGGKAKSGVKDADNPKALRAALKRDGVLLTEAREGGSRRKAGAAPTTQADFNPRALLRAFRERETADSAEVATITRQLGTLLKAGVPLAESLAALAGRGIIAACHDRSGRSR
jgi:general secretion pathway protein F